MKDRKHAKLVALLSSGSFITCDSNLVKHSLLFPERSDQIG